MRQHATILTWRRAGSSGARLLVLLAALAGLFAMHGMSDHGTTHHGSSPTHQASQAVPAMQGTQWIQAATMAAHTASAAPAAGLHRAVHESADDREIMSDLVATAKVAATGDVLDDGLHVAMGLCLAILAAAVALALRRLRTWAHPLTPALLDTLQRLLPARARAPDPPDLHALSIQRC